MKAEDVIKQLRAVVPKLTDVFSSTISVTSLSRSGTTVTALSTDHGLTTGNYVTIKGAYEKNGLTSLTFADGVASATTTSDHDLTEKGSSQPYTLDFNQATVSGATESEYNGTFDVLSAVNRRNFTYSVTGTPASPATGAPVLHQDAYNGRYQVTVVDSDTFTYQISTTPNSPAAGSITAEKEARISGAVSIERAFNGYTKQLAGELWAFVIIGDPTISKDRSIFSDATSTRSKQDEWRERIIEPFSVFVFVPSTKTISSRPSRDLAEDIRPILYKSLVGSQLPTTFTDEGWSMITPVGDRLSGEASNGAFYVHEYQFERVVDVTYEDTVGNEDTVAFRDFDFDIVFEQEQGNLSASVDLDDEPL